MNASGTSHSRNSFRQKTGIRWHMAQHLKFHSEVENKKEKMKRRKNRKKTVKQLFVTFAENKTPHYAVLEYNFRSLL